MVLTPSTMARLGAPAPDFTLKDVMTGKTVSLSNFSKFTLSKTATDASRASLPT